jgi:hypothetical protein
MDPITAAIAAGAAAGLTSTASQAVRDAYDALKNVIRRRFPRVDVTPVEELPESGAKQASLSEDLVRFGADRDTEVVRLAEALVAVIEREAPEVADRVGVDLEQVKGEFLTIRRVAGGVRAREVETRGGIEITDVTASGGPVPN